MHNNKLNNSRRTNNSKNKTVMKIHNFWILKMAIWTKIYLMKNRCLNLMNSRSKMLLIAFSHSPVFKDLNTWKDFNSYLKHSCKNKSKNLRLNLRRGRNRFKTSRMEKLCSQRVLDLKKEMMLNKLRTNRCSSLRKQRI